MFRASGRTLFGRSGRLLRETSLILSPHLLTFLENVSPADVMAEIKHGTVTLTVADHLAPPPSAGQLTKEEVARLPRAPRSVGLACAQAADALEKAGAKLTVPPALNKEALLAAASRADDIDQVIVDVEVILARLKQANLMFDAEAWSLLRQVNDQVKAQGKHNPELLNIFEPIVRFFAKGPRPGPEAPPAA